MWFSEGKSSACDEGWEFEYTVTSCLNYSPEVHSGRNSGVRKCRKRIGKDVGFSSCAAPPLYRVSSYFTEVLRGSVAEVDQKGSGDGRTKVRARNKERYVEIARSSRGDMTSLIFELQEVQVGEMGLYTLCEYRKELRLVRRNRAREAVQDLRTTRQLETINESRTIETGSNRKVH